LEKLIIDDNYETNGNFYYELIVGNLKNNKFNENPMSSFTLNNNTMW